MVTEERNHHIFLQSKIIVFIYSPMSLIFTQGIPPLEKYRIKIFGATAAT